MTTSVRVNTALADEARKALAANSRSEAVRLALREIVDLRRFKRLMTKHAGKLRFAAYDE